MSALLQMGYDESSLLGEIEKILGTGSLTDATKSPSIKPSISPPRGFTFNENQKHSTSAGTSTSSTQVSRETTSYSTLVSASTATGGGKWMRTATGGYVKAPSQESVLEESKNKSSPSPVPPKRPVPPASENGPTFKPSKSPSSPSASRGSSVPSSPKFMPKNSNFNQPNQFTSHYQVQTSPTPQRKVLAKPQETAQNIPGTRDLAPSQEESSERRGPTPPVRTTYDPSGGGRGFMNSSPVGYSSADKGDCAWSAPHTNKPDCHDCPIICDACR